MSDKIADLDAEVRAILLEAATRIYKLIPLYMESSPARGMRITQRTTKALGPLLQDVNGDDEDEDQSSDGMSWGGPAYNSKKAKKAKNPEDVLGTLTTSTEAMNLSHRLRNLLSSLEMAKGLNEVELCTSIRAEVDSLIRQIRGPEQPTVVEATDAIDLGPIPTLVS